MTLLELMVSQVVVLFVVAGVFALITAMMKSFHSTDAGAQAQIRLREVGHVLLRDLVALGGADGRAGELLQVEDFVDAPDVIHVFRVNPGLCGGGMAVGSTDGEDVIFDAPCPFSSGSDTCAPEMLEGGMVVLVGERASMLARLSSVEDGPACRARVSSSDAENAAALERLRRDLAGAQIDSMEDALGLLVPGSVRLGSRFSYRVEQQRLQRRVDDAPWQTVVDGVFDLQVALAYDVDQSGTIGEDEWLGKRADRVLESQLPGANARTYFGAEVALATFGRAADGILQDPPRGLMNRAATAPTDDERRRRYRTARFFMAARNRAAGGAP